MLQIRVNIIVKHIDAVPAPRLITVRVHWALSAMNGDVNYTSQYIPNQFESRYVFIRRTQKTQTHSSACLIS